jgi:hypothetical protein
MSSATISLYGSLRTPKVDAGLAVNAESVRRLDADSIISPARDLYDLYGREAELGSLDGYTYGMDPEYIITLENAIRNPQYSYYLNVPQGLQGVNQDAKTLTPQVYMNKTEADSLGVNRFQSLGFAPTYKLTSALRPQTKNLPKQDRRFLAEQTRLERIMNRVNVAPFYSDT